MNSNEKVVNPGYYILKSLVVSSAVGIRSEHFGVMSMDISNLVPAITVSVSIDSDVLHGSFKVYDSVGFLENFPLRGEERAAIVIEDSMDTSSELDVFCYKIDGVQTSDENGVIMYTVHFVSFQSFQAGTRVLIRAYKDKRVSDIALDIFQECYETQRISRPSDFMGLPGEMVSDPSNKGIIVYPHTDGNIRCVIPRMKTGEAMKFLTNRAYSTTSPSCSFRFFENLRSYYFISDEALFDTAAQRNKLFKFTYMDTIPKSPDHFHHQMNNLDKIVNSRRVNTIDDMYNGTYRNKVTVLDIVNGTTNLKEPGFDYGEASYFSGGKIEDRHTPEFADQYISEEIQKRFLVIKDYMTDQGFSDATLDGNRHYPDIISNKVSYRKHLDSITIEASGPGRMDISAGDIVDLHVPEFNAEGGKFEKNLQLSGKYIVKSVTYLMNMETMINDYTLVKREWSRGSDGEFGMRAGT
ncbi:MAG: hypothetical protein WCY93_08940 [Anaerolineaceae bacterium]